MSRENDSYKSVLGELVTKRERLDKAIEAMRNLIEIETETREESRERRATTIPRRKRSKNSDPHGADRDCWRCVKHDLEFLDRKEFRKHYYREHLKKRRDGLPLSKDPEAAKQAFNPQLKPQFKKGGLGCEPCELNFPNLVTLEKHQELKHGVRFRQKYDKDKAIPANGIGVLPGSDITTW